MLHLKKMTTLTDLVNASLKKNLLRNIVLSEAEVTFLRDQLIRLGTIGNVDTGLLNNIISKLDRYDS